MISELLSIIDLITGRRNFEYSLAECIRYVVCSVWCCCRRKKAETLSKDHKLNKARGRLIKELDIVRLIHKLRNFDVT